MKWILVAGYGSIGRRHYRNLRSLGYEDVRLLRSQRTPAPGFETPEGTPVYHDLSQALADRPFAVVVANPTSLHVATVAAALKAGAHVLLEKPVAADLRAARQLRELNRAQGPALCSMAYCFRYHPLYRALRQAVHEGRLGRALHVRTWQASYLPAWHPWEDYRESYASRRELGGGVLRTLDHDIDFVRWLLGEPQSVMASVARLSALEIDVDDTADMIFSFSGNARASIHLCFCRRDYERGVSVTGELGSAHLDWNRRTLTLNGDSGAADMVALPEDYDLNEIYREMIREAMAGFAAGQAAIPLRDGVANLAMALAAEQASARQQSINIEDI